MLSEDCLIKKIGYGSFEKFIDMVNGKWKLRILYFLAVHSILRYGELKKYLYPITHKMLSKQLKELEYDKLIIRTEFPQVPPKVEYQLSEKGLDLKPIFEEMCKWITHSHPL